ncbi:ATP-grasp domain-containing protein [Vibrio sp. S4M6]|uniref:ATP-grasp domain-containing protein n=1 Tax=Vibrio sinus TaxID=2946865 RepID=UPI00202A73B9|nr:ATP-grasp domain-containing protein [Vibrio sinus]MCL9781708.1 ATP-grasp domain-containing protein [Vibrio sinus]
MKDILIFLSSVGLQSYSLTNLANQYDLILVTDEKETPNLTQQIQQYFTQIIISHSGTYCGPIISLDIQATLPLLQNCIKQYASHQIHIINTSEANTVVAAELREHFDIHGMKPCDARCFTDKALMKATAEEHGINTAKSLTLSHHYDDLAGYLGESFIVKPVDAAGSFAVEIIHSQEELNRYHAKYATDEGQFLAEAFISGTMYHADFVIYNTKPIFRACSEYLYPNLDFKSGKHLSSFPVFDKDIQSKIFDFTNHCLKALGYHDGIYHLELFIQDGECVFLEVGARIPAAMVVKMYEVTYGINIADLSAAVLSQSHTKSVQQKVTGEYFIWSYLAKSEGRIRKLSLPDFNSDYDIQWEVEAGQLTHHSQSIIDRVGVLTSQSHHLESIQEDFEHLREYQPTVF